ncbi:hypothetical protein BC937DRAFT_88593 [Endogone sp. FLAS-F59071]|nr:hypothetical protein BC937DRAFT_88593 [Endogone sp. FLAS-F59071]|eukprot:RUS18584.1 hypothetical protein BC937DRAFT_88593 [Endogone sp. FLAS-F59071]
MQVTQNRGWKQVGDPFNFPPTCTNSAYILKGVYTRNLLGWEEENYWRRPWVPPRDGDEVHRTRSVQHTKTDKSASPAPQRTVVRDPARSTATAKFPATSSAAFTQPQPSSVVYPQRPTFQPPVTYQPPVPVATAPVAYTMATTQRPIVLPAEVFYIEGGHRNRILLALKSGLPNEIDWAFNNLVKISYECPENFHLEYIPTLLESLLHFAEPFFQHHVLLDSELTMASDDVNGNQPLDTEPTFTTIPADYHLFNSKDYQENLERVLQVFHILRNFSFLEVNIKLFSSHGGLRRMLMTGLFLPPHTQYIELRQHCLDLLENISPQIVVKSRQDEYVICLSRLLYANDRALILGSIRALTRLAVNEVNERALASIDYTVTRRLLQLLLVNDEELLAATLEYLYQYSSLHGDFAAQLVHHPGNLINLLIGFLSFKSTMQPPPQHQIGHAGSYANGYAQGQQPPPTQQRAASIPDLSNYNELQEPYRCLGWIKDRFELTSADATLTLNDLYAAYSTRFAPDGLKLLDMNACATVMKIAFPLAAANPEANPANATNPEGTARYPLLSIRGVRSKAVPASSVDANGNGQHTNNGEPSITLDGTCQWTGCSENFEDESQLYRHVLDTHISKDAVSFDCQWINCRRLPQGCTSRSIVVAHFKTHFPLIRWTKPSPPGTQQQRRWSLVNNSPILVDDSEVYGVPLTTALVLRNLARPRKNMVHFLPFEKELSLLSIQRPKLAKYILNILTELKI